MSKKYNDKNSVHGVVVAEKCGCCGHHEIGIRKKDGKYIRLEPGMKIVGYLITPRLMGKVDRPRKVEIPPYDKVKEGFIPGS